MIFSNILGTTFYILMYSSCVDYTEGSHAFWQMHFYDLSLTFQVVCYINSLIYRDWTYKSNFQPKKYFKSKHLIFCIYLKIN